MTAFATVAVLGAGTMGHGIAQAAAAAGCRVNLYDVDADAVQRALGRIRANLDKGVELGRVSDEVRATALEGLRAAPSLGEATRDAQLVIEAAPESLDLKRGLLQQVEALADESAVLATNTSSLSIAQLAGALARPHRFLGLHFFNPAHVMPLVEVVRGPGTGENELERAVAFVQQLGKVPLLVRDSPGFATSRLGVLLGLEAMRMLEEGVADAETIDKAMELGYRHPVGPLRLTDLVGLDVRLGIAEYLHRELGSEAFRPPEILRRMVAEGKLGKKAGQGFYRWEER